MDFGGADALLIIGDSDRSADLFYATGFRAPDPFVFLWMPQSRLLLIGDLELDRARQQADADEVLSLSHYTKSAAERQEQNGLPEGRYGALLVLLAERQLRTLLVPADFPVEAADLLRQHGLTLQVAPAPLFPQRAKKRVDEVDAIAAAQAAAEGAMACAIEAIRCAEVRADGVLVRNGEALTSEALRRLVHGNLLESDYTAQHTIIACGEDGCDPHRIGSGPLEAGRPVIIDIFPRSDETGYFGDLTRTVVKGAPDEAVQRMYDAVARGQQLALEHIAAGVDGRDVHRQIEELFADEGFQSGEKNGRMQGFFHGTGHGLGLEIHEAPSISSSRSCILEEGQVVTVEPGLYYPGLGGVRIEDVVVVEEGGCRNLTAFPKYFEV